MSDIQDLPRELESKLQELIVESAKATLYDIVKYELSELAEHDPSFSELVRQAKTVLVSIEGLMEKAGGHTKVVYSFKEYIEILESIAQSIVDKNNKLLTDNITHLEEFLSIETSNKQGE